MTEQSYSQRTQDFAQIKLSGDSHLFPVKVNGLYGYINRNGVEQISPTFLFAGEFHDGLAFAISKTHKSGYIDTLGNWVVQPDFNFPNKHHNYFKFSHGWAPVELPNGQYRFLQPTSGNQTASFDLIFPYVDDRALVHQNGKIGFLGPDGNWAIEPTYQQALPWMPSASSFSEGFAMVRLTPDTQGLGYIDTHGEESIVAWFEEAFPFSEGLALVRRDFFKGYKYVNYEGQTAFKTSFRIASGGSFSEGLADVGIDETGRYGYIDKTGEFAIEPKFDATLKFSETRAPVSLKGKWTFIDKFGNFISEPKYERVGHFRNGLALVFTEHTVGYIDLKGHAVWETPRN